MPKEPSDQASDELQLEDNEEDLGLTEYIVYVKTILNQLVKITLAIRKSGNKYRFEDVDANCDEAAFESFRRYLTALVLREHEGNTEVAKGLTVDEKIKQASDPNRLSLVQKRLVRANTLRRNRINFMTKSSRSKAKPQPGLTPGPLVNLVVPQPEMVLVQEEVRDPTGLTERLETSNDQSAAQQSDLLETSTVVRTATDPGSKLEIKPILRKPSLSTATRMTRIGASQVYPRRPERTSGESLICPFCNEQLPPEVSEAKLDTSWK